MTDVDKLRGWALGMRSLLECCGGREMAIQLEGGQVIEYVLGVGLVYRGREQTIRLPEEALDEERWAVCDGR